MPYQDAGQSNMLTNLGGMHASLHNVSYNGNKNMLRHTIKNAGGGLRTI